MIEVVVRESWLKAVAHSAHTDCLLAALRLLFYLHFTYIVIVLLSDLIETL